MKTENMMVRSLEPAVEPNPSAPGGRNLGVAAVDPIPIFREGLASLVHRADGLRWVGHVASQHAALRLCEQLKPDVIVLDSAMDPNCHLIRLLSSGDPALVIITLIRETNRTAQYLTEAIAAGARGAMHRATDPRRLAEAIRRAYAERSYLDPTLATLLAGPKYQPAGRAEGRPPPPRTLMPLSRREYQVLALLADGLENLGIAKILFVSVETVRTHVKGILRKLSARDRTHAVAVAFRSGILTAQPDDDAHAIAPPPRTTATSAPRIG